ncbi:MAG TPA: ABC transporter permease [Vicinamibacterales bacterium]|nr:ABC transporter permease [Vicinamibacterales bacterium]
MATTLLDVRDTLRAVRREPVYAGAVIATLALTLGASTAVFSIVNGVVLRPLAYREAQRLVSIREVVPRIARRYASHPVNARHFEEWRRQATAFASIAEVEWRTTNLTGAGDPAQVVIVRASGTVFDVLQMPVALGRPLTRDDERPDHPPVAVISQRLWADRLGRDPQVVGRGLILGGTQYTVVGVLEPRSELPAFDLLSESASLSSKFDLVVPFRLNFANIGWMGQFNYAAVARLKAGVTLEQARAELDVIQQSVAQIATRETHEPIDLRGWIMPLDESIVGRARLGLLLLLGAIGGVVLIACANLANLSLTRALGRMREAAVRSALGASRARLVGGVVLEQLLLAATGGALGVLIARQGLNLFVKTAPIDLPRVNEVVIDGRVLGFAALVAIVAGLCVALLPAWRMGRGDVQATLRGGGHGATDRGGLRVRATLLAVQVALSVTLLVVTGLFITSFVQLLRVDPGFSPERVTAVEIAPIANRYPDEKARAALYDRILASARDLPGLTSAAWTSALPLTGETWVDLIARIGDTRTSSQKSSANYRFIGPDYFRTLSMPIAKGRAIDERDRNRAVVPAVISARAAQTLWPGEDPLGQQFARGDPSQHFEVVGIVADGHATALEAESPLMVYVPYWFNNEGKSVLMVRTPGEAAAIAGELRRVIHAVDPEIAIADVSPLRQIVDKALAGRRYQMWLFTAFGAVALVIATVGVYATTAYGVSRRRREMNIRAALGARASQVIALVLRQSLTPLFAGIAAGCAGALAIGTVVASLLFKVRAADPFVLATVVVLVGAVGVLASATAARQGMRVDPAAALREE